MPPYSGGMKRGVILALAALVLVVAACGSGSRLSRSEYQAKLHSAFVAARNADDAAHRGGPDQVKALKAVAAAYAGLAATLKGTHPPVGVQSINDRLVAGASAQAQALDTLAARLERTPQPARYRVLAEFDANAIPGQKLFDDAVATLESKGYRFRATNGTTTR